MIRLNSHQLRKSRVGLPADKTQHEPCSNRTSKANAKLRQGRVVLNSHQLRASKEKIAQSQRNEIKRNPLVIVLDNVTDTYNIGSFFRLADAIGAQKVCLCGPVVTPPNIKIHRASIGTWKWVPWQQYDSTRECLAKLKKDGYQVIACEQAKNSVNYLKAKYKFPLAIVAGSEQYGISEEILNLCDQIVEIPMYGINVSLNVLIATSIISYAALARLSPPGK